jgi:hypothetical protein
MRIAVGEGLRYEACVRCRVEHIDRIGDVDEAD